MRRSPEKWRPGSEDRDERGAISAEFAIALPAVIITLALCVGAIMVSSTAVRLTDATADAARLASRGESDRAVSWVADQVSGASATLTVDSDMYCIEASVTATVAGMSFPLDARSCALGEPR